MIKHSMPFYSVLMEEICLYAYNNYSINGYFNSEDTIDFLMRDMLAEYESEKNDIPISNRFINKKDGYIALIGFSKQSLKEWSFGLGLVLDYKIIIESEKSYFFDIIKNFCLHCGVNFIIDKKDYKIWLQITPQKEEDRMFYGDSLFKLNDYFKSYC